VILIAGEYWQGNVRYLEAYLSKMPKGFCLFDVPLLYKFSNASKSSPDFDLRTIYDSTLVASKPANAITLVQNHDTQPGQSLYAEIKDFFKPLAYALILLRKEGHPLVFYGDLYGISGPPPYKSGPVKGLAQLMLVRKLYAHGSQTSYWDHPNCIGWVRRGGHGKAIGCAVLMSNAGETEKKMSVGRIHAKQVWTDVVYLPSDCSVGLTSSLRIIPEKWKLHLMGLVDLRVRVSLLAFM
jgi:alpha-amylase